MKVRHIFRNTFLVIVLIVVGLLTTGQALAAVYSASAPTFATQTNPTAVVNTGALNVRSGPGINYGVVEVSYRGHLVALLGRNSNSSWAKVRLFSGREGWVNASLIQPSVTISSLPVLDGSTPAPAATAVVNSGALNVRSGPGVNFGVVEVSYRGHVVALLGRNSNSSWAKVRLFSGREGWVNASLIQPNVAISSLPVVDSPAPPAPAATAVVNTGALNVRSGPGVGYGIIDVSYRGHVVALLGRNSNSSWARVRLFSGKEGWVNASLIQPTVAISSLPVANVPTLPAAAIIATGALNVRSGPGISYTPIAIIYQGQSVSLIGRNANSSWAQIRLANGQVGWVNASLIQPNIAVGNLPITG